MVEVVSQFRAGPRDAFIKAELGWAGQSNRISRYSETPVPWPLHEAVETQLNTLNSNIVQLCFQFGRNMGLLYLICGCNGSMVMIFMGFATETAQEQRQHFLSWLRARLQDGDVLVEPAPGL